MSMNCKVTSFMQDLNTCEVANLQKWFNDESKIWIPPAKEIQGGKIGKVTLFSIIGLETSQFIE